MEEYKEIIEKDNLAQSLFAQGSNSYISKEKFVEMISNLDFKAIERADIHFITGITVENNKEGEPRIKTFGYDFEIR